MANNQLAYKIDTFAHLTELSRRFVLQQIYDGHLQAVKKGGIWLIPADSAQEYLSPKKEETQGQEIVLQATA